MSSLQLTLVPMGTGCPHAYLFPVVTVYSGCSLFPAQPRPHLPAGMPDTLSLIPPSVHTSPLVHPSALNPLLSQTPSAAP